MNNPAPNQPPAPDPLAVALSKIDPAPHGFDWNALMFAAGRASKGRALMFWRIAAGVCAVIACGFAFAYFTQSPVIVERTHTVYVDRVVPVPATLEPQLLPGMAPTEPATGSTGWSYDAPPEQGAAMNWLNTRNNVLTAGLGMLPDPGPKAPPLVRGDR